MPITKKIVPLKKKVATKPTKKTTITKVPAKKKSILHRIFRSQKGLIQQQTINKTQVGITAAILGTIGIVAVVASHGSTSSVPKGSAYGCSSTATLHQGSNGSCVSYLQALLKYHGYLSTNPDGGFGSKTDAAVRNFQRSKGQASPDGAVGPTTWGWLTGTKVAAPQGSSYISSPSGALFSGLPSASRTHYSYGGGHYSYRYQIYATHAKYGLKGYFRTKYYASFMTSDYIAQTVKESPSLYTKSTFEFFDYDTDIANEYVYEVDTHFNVSKPLIVKNPYYKM